MKKAISCRRSKFRPTFWPYFRLHGGAADGDDRAYRIAGATDAASFPNQEFPENQCALLVGISLHPTNFFFLKKKTCDGDDAPTISCPPIFKQFALPACNFQENEQGHTREELKIVTSLVMVGISYREKSGLRSFVQFTNPKGQISLVSVRFCCLRLTNRL